MSESKPRLAIVSSHKICCPLAYYADALKDFLSDSFEVEIIDLKTTFLLRQEGTNYQKLSEEYIDQLCSKLQKFDVVNVHLEFGIYGITIEQIVSRVIKICRSSKRLIFTVHTIDYNPNSGFFNAYQKIMNDLKERPASNPFHLIAHLPEEGELLKKHFGFNNVSDFPLIYLTNERREYFCQKRNPNLWKKQFGFNENDITIGMFGLMSPHKNYLHALRTLNLLPPQYKLLVIGEAHHMSIKEWKVDPVVQEMLTYLDEHPALADRVVFTGKRNDEKYYEDLANIDFVLLPSFEVRQSGSATFSNALELGRAVLKSNTSNCKGYESYFPDCFEVFDIGNYYETKHKIINFDSSKIDNLHVKNKLFSELQLQKMYLDIYETMKSSTPVPLTNKSLNDSLDKITRISRPVKKITHSQFVRAVFKRLPLPVQNHLRKLKAKLLLHK
jgi:glycosyltransferase involved in cell wall biosynthesis